MYVYVVLTAERANGSVIRRLVIWSGDETEALNRAVDKMESDLGPTWVVSARSVQEEEFRSLMKQECMEAINAGFD